MLKGWNGFRCETVSMFQYVGRGGKDIPPKYRKEDTKRMVITLEYVRFLIEMTTDMLDELNTMENELIENETKNKEDDIEKVFLPAYIVRATEKKKQEGESE